MMMRYHVVNRTSQKGVGQPFIGTCALCGKTGLRASAALEFCENVRCLSRDDAVIEAITGSRDG